RAERAGVVYVDIWDGFVDESGKYSNFGPDYEGQMRRLRSSDGIFFTKSGAVKLAHYVEREIRRYMNSRVTPVALPAGPLAPAAPDGKPAARPIAGPVIPLTVTSGNSEVLLGSAGNSSAHGDAIATRVLVKGEPVAAPRGRADDFTLQRGNDDSLADPVAPVPAGALASTPAEPPRTRALSLRLPPRKRPPPRKVAAPASPRKIRSIPRIPRVPITPRTQAADRSRRGTMCPARQERSPSAGVGFAEPQRGSMVDPIRNLSTACAAWRPSRIAPTTSDWPRRISPAANTFGSEV